MKNLVIFLIFLVINNNVYCGKCHVQHQFHSLIKFNLDDDEVTVECPETTRVHSTECNKYFKCIKLPANRLSWITLTCQEGLVYDKNLRSCAIPPEDWECGLSSSEEDDNNNENIYGVENLEILDDGAYDGEDRQVKESGSDLDDDFLEIIDGDKNLKSISSEVKNDEEEVVVFSGDGSVSSSREDGSVSEISVTPSSMTTRMITTQVQRLTQLVDNFANNKQDVTPDDLNSFLYKQKIHADEYQKVNSEDKTPIPKNGKIHDNIMSEIINRQNSFKKLTTEAMDALTTMRPIFMAPADRNPITEIKLKSSQGIDGSGSHQIVVNRPEGSVLFNVPPSSSSSDQKHMPYLSQDILKTILEISKQMVVQNHQKTEAYSPTNYQPQPFYYAVPIPILSPSPQNNYQNYFNQNLTTMTTTTTTSTPSVANKRRKPPSKNKNKDSYYSAELLSNFQPNYMKNQPNYYNNYPSYYNSPPQQPYNPFYNTPSNYYYQQQQQYPISSFGGQQNEYGYDMFYEKRPFVSQSSASSYLDQSQEPYRKESLSFHVKNGDEYDVLGEESEYDSDDDGSFYDDSVATVTEKNPLDDLICTHVLARQANKTDCFKYYVCNAKTKEVLSYKCPMMTAFNDVTKFCDATSYETCRKMQKNERGIMKNKKVIQAHKALMQAKRQSQKAQQIANMLKKQSQNFISSNYYKPHTPLHYHQQVFENNVNPFINTPPSPPAEKSYLQIDESEVEEVKTSPITAVMSVNNKKKKKKNKSGKVKCKNPGSIADPTDSKAYWHCFKDPNDNRMKRIHKKCSANLTFCPTTRFCSPSC